MADQSNKRDVAGLMKEARDLRNRRSKMTPEDIEAFGKTLASQGEDLSRGAPRKTVAEVKDTTTRKGSAKPADFIAPYYRDKFPLEAAKAMLYNKGRPDPVLEESSYAKLFDDIEFERNEGFPEPDAYLRTPQKVRLTNKEGEEIDKANNETYVKWSKSKDPKLRRRAEEAVVLNSFASAEDMASGSPSAAEHEFTHHYARPVKGGVADKAYIAAAKGGKHKSGDYYEEFHTAGPAELTQAAGRFQRELFAETGKRITKPEEFMELVNSDEKMEFMTPEAKRYLVFARRLLNESEPYDPNDDFFGARKKEKQSREDAIRRMAEILPATVSVDESFEGRANERIAGKMSRV